MEYFLSTGHISLANLVLRSKENQTKLRLLNFETESTRQKKIMKKYFLGCFRLINILFNLYLIEDVAVSVLFYDCSTWTVTKDLETNYIETTLECCVLLSKTILKASTQ